MKTETTETHKAQLNARVPAPMRKAVSETSRRSGVSLELIVEDALRVYYGAETPDSRTRRRILVDIGREELKAAGVSLGQEEKKLEREKGFEPSTFTLAKRRGKSFLKDSGSLPRYPAEPVSRDAQNVVRLPPVPTIPMVSAASNLVSNSPLQFIAAAA